MIDWLTEWVNDWMNKLINDMNEWNDVTWHETKLNQKNETRETILSKEV